MHTNITRLTIAAAAATLLLGLAGAPASAHGDDQGDNTWNGQRWSGSYDGGQRGRASSYINPDVGMPTFNPDVTPGSNCYRPDQSDKQQFSTAGTTNRNVHNDACFLDRNGNKLNGPATFQSSGVGAISACPDPDGAGPEFAILSDRNGDGRNDMCFQSSFQIRGTVGDMEFHARLNNTSMAGRQNVVWCSDRDQDGCADEWNRSSIYIDWSANGQTSFGSDRSGYSGGWGG